MTEHPAGASQHRHPDTVHPDLAPESPLDDYGTGFSNLQTSKYSPMSSQTDPSLTWQRSGTPRGRAFIAAAAPLLSRSIPSSCLEGVETEAHLHVVEDLGISLGQDTTDLVMPPEELCSPPPPGIGWDFHDVPCLMH